MRFAPCLILPLLLMPATGGSQEACDEFLKAPPVGHWSEYQIMKEGEPELGMRLAIIGSEERAGREMHWLELAIRPADEDGSTIIKLLIPGYPVDVEELEEIVMKSGDGPALKVGGPMMGMIRKIFSDNPGLSAAEECKSMAAVGEESVTVPAGTYQTRHYRNVESGAEVWASGELPFGIVKSFDGEEYVVELIAHGEGAETAITETPQDLFGN